MKTYLHFLMAVLGLFLLTACDKVRIENSVTMTEPAVVADFVYTPAHHGTDLRPTMDFEGNIGLEITSVDIPRKYAVIFQCKHGKFIIENNQDKTKALWEKLKLGQKVTVHYLEVYRVVYVKDVATERRLIKYDFLDAVLEKEPLESERE